MQTMLLSIDAPVMIPSAATSRCAVSSTTAGGLPGPAAIARLPEFIASFTTPGPPVTARMRTSGCFISACALSMVGSPTEQTRFSGPPAATIASLRRCTCQALTLEGGAPPRAARFPRPPRGADPLLGGVPGPAPPPLRPRLYFDPPRVAPPQHADGVADDGLGGIRGGRDRAEHAVRRALDHRH